MKTLTKVLIIFMVAVCIVSILPQNVFATDPSTAVSSLNNATSKVDTTGLIDIIKNLLGFLQIAAGLVAVLMIAFTGFNYIIATPDVKGEMKSKMVPIIVGLILVFGAVSIAKFILGVVGK